VPATPPSAPPAGRPPPPPTPGPAGGRAVPPPLPTPSGMLDIALSVSLSAIGAHGDAQGGRKLEKTQVRTPTPYTAAQRASTLDSAASLSSVSKARASSGANRSAKGSMTSQTDPHP